MIRLDQDLKKYKEEHLLEEVVYKNVVSLVNNEEMTVDEETSVIKKHITAFGDIDNYKGSLNLANYFGLKDKGSNS
jgi:hypothetical protein